MKKSELKNTRQFKAAKRKSEQARKDGIDRPFAYMNTVPLFWAVEYDLSPLELLTYCFIRDCTLNMKEKAFTGSVTNLCSRFNVTIPTQRKALEGLVEKGFIIKEKSPYGQSQWVRYVDGLASKWDREIKDQRLVQDILDINKVKLQAKRGL